MTADPPPPPPPPPRPRRRARKPAPQASASAPRRADAGPERWRSDAGPDTKAVLEIPGALVRTRTFDIDVRFVVRVPESARGSWHALEVEVDGRMQWSRRIPSNNPGQTDSLDYHCRLVLEPGRSLKVRASAQAQGAVPQQLRIDAEEAQD